MTRALARTHFHSSNLIRTLASMAVLGVAESTDALGEQLGRWIDFTDAIALSAVHGASAPAAANGLYGTQTEVASLEEEFANARLGLEAAIKKSAASSTGRMRSELVLPKIDVPLDDAKVYVPFRRYHQAHQRDMEANVRTLRAKVRDGVAKAMPRLQQLAALDATFEGVLCEREGRLLGTIPALLERRFNHLRKAHLQAVSDMRQDDNPNDWMQPGAWLARFCGELQAVLLAELDLRLQPAVGLLEAFHNEKKQYA